MSNEIRIGWEQAAKAIAERGKGWSSRGDYALAMECSQLVSMLHDLKPLAAPASAAALSEELPPLHKAARNVVAQFNDPHVSLASVARYVNELEAAIAHQPPKEALSEKAIDAIWESLPGLTIIKDKPQDQWNRLLRHEFAAAIEAATGPNKALAEALQTIVERFGPCQKDYIFSKRAALDKARAALSAAGVTLKGE